MDDETPTPPNDAAAPSGSPEANSAKQVWDASDLFKGAKAPSKSVDKEGAPPEAREGAPLDLRAAAEEKRTSGAEELRPDPTSVFQPGPYPDIALPDIEPWARQLRDNRILVLSSHDPMLMYAIAQGLLQHPEFTACEKRQVESQSHDLNIDEFIMAAAGAKPRVIAAYAISERALSFLRSLSPDGPTVNRQIKDLRDRDMWLLIVGRASHLGEIERRDPTQAFPYLEPPVGFLEPRLRAAFGSRAAEFAASIAYQQERGLWGASEEGFFVNLRKSLKDGSLRQKIREFDEAIAIGTEDTLRGQRQPLRAMQLLEAVPEGVPELQPLYQWVMFTGTFFREMPVKEFSAILKRLVPPPTPEPTPDGREKIARPKSLYDSWPLNEYKILTLCQMYQETETRKLSAPAIRFVESNLQTDMEEAFRSAYYGHYAYAVQAIEEGALVIHDEPLIRGGVVELLATRAVLESDYAGGRYVLDLLLSAVRAHRGDADASSGELLGAIEDLPATRRSMLFFQAAAVILKVAEKNQIAVAEAGLAQLRSIGLLGPVLTVLNRGTRGDAPPETLAHAARILLSTDDFVLFAATLKRVREAICEPSRGCLLTLLLASLRRELATSVLRYLTQYTLSGYRLDARANPMALALQHVSELSADNLTPVAAALVAEDFQTGLEEDEIWDLFHTWLAPEAMREEVLLLFDRLVPALNAASLNLYQFLESRAAGPSDSRQMRLAAMILGDTYNGLASLERRKALAAAVAKTMEKKARSQFAQLLYAIANAINTGILSLQAPAPVFDRTEQQKRSQFLTRWKRLRDGLRQVKSEIDAFQSAQLAAPGER
jgi:hypothetical protein